MKSACLVTMGVVVHGPEGLPRSDGKAIRIVDKRNTETVNI
jgi:phenylacetate-CoA ligase